MILEEIDGDVKVVLNGKNLTIGDTIEDNQYPLVAVIGTGKATFRVDANCTVETKGAKPTEEIVAAPVVEKPAAKSAAKPAAKLAPEPAPKVEETPAE